MAENRTWKKQKLMYAAFLGVVLAAFSTASFGEEAKRVWLGSACYQMRLGVWDKLGGGPYVARYVFKTDSGRTFVAEKNGNDDSNTAEVVFPDDFHEERIFNGKKITLPAGHCSQGSYTWAIYANGILFETGKIAFSK